MDRKRGREREREREREEKNKFELLLLSVSDLCTDKVVPSSKSLLSSSRMVMVFSLKHLKNAILKLQKKRWIKLGSKFLDATMHLSQANSHGWKP